MTGGERWAIVSHELRNTADGLDAAEAAADSQVGELVRAQLARLNKVAPWWLGVAMKFEPMTSSSMRGLADFIDAHWADYGAGPGKGKPAAPPAAAAPAPATTEEAPPAGDVVQHVGPGGAVVREIPAPASSSTPPATEAPSPTEAPAGEAPHAT